ncbi:MAG: TatD family hydrolase [Treponema sp.]|nr:TatD family hydrolase [Treponema sp.]
MKLIDIGINLMNSSYNKDRDDVVKAALAAGVSPLVITGSSERSSLDAALYASAYNGKKPRSLYTTAGVHPHEVKNCGNDTISFLRDLVLEKSGEPAPPDNPPDTISGGSISTNAVSAGRKFDIKAIGECGLDYNRDFSPRDTQRRWFVKQAELAAELNLPLFLHERDAFSDFSVILREYIKAVPAAVVHCFTGTADEMDYYLSLGCYIGITGWICDERRGTHLAELVKNIPPGRLMLETDGPYLLPRNLPLKVRNRRNESQYLPHIAETAARYIGKDVAKLAKETSANAKKFFGIT